MNRWLEAALAALGLLLAAPLILVLGLAVRLTSPGPALYRSRRTGRDGRPFDMLKLRTMRDGAARGPAITVSNDARVTPFGRWLRASKLDELPQLVNVLRGEMSLVGPRPESPHYTALYDARQREILHFRPGLTSPASLRYRDEESALVGDDWERAYLECILPHKLELDLEYARRRSLAGDLHLLAATFATLLGQRRRTRPAAS